MHIAPEHTYIIDWYQICACGYFFARVPACLPACLPPCLPPCMPACLSVCLSVSVNVLLAPRHSEFTLQMYTNVWRDSPNCPNSVLRCKWMLGLGRKARRTSRILAPTLMLLHKQPKKHDTKPKRTKMRSLLITIHTDHFETMTTMTMTNI